VTSVALALKAEIDNQIEAGALVAIKARVLMADEDAVSVRIFSGLTFSVPIEDVVSVLPPEADEEPLKPGDKALDSGGRSWDVVDVKSRDDERVIVMLWDDVRGAEWEFANNLTRAGDAD
jgi:hypothetical protein